MFCKTCAELPGRGYCLTCAAKYGKKPHPAAIDREKWLKMRGRKISEARRRRRLEHKAQAAERERMLRAATFKWAP